MGYRVIIFVVFILTAGVALSAAPASPEVASALATDVALIRGGFEPGRQPDVTAGDVWLYDPKTHLLAAGDLVTLPAPFFDTACPVRWQLALATLDAVEFKTLVPGHGEPMSREDFALYRRAFDALLACAASTASNGECSDAWQHDAAIFLITDWDKTWRAPSSTTI